MKFTRQQRLGLLLTALLMALLALVFALTRPAPAVGVTQLDQIDSSNQSDSLHSPKKSDKKPAAPPPSRSPLDEEF